MSEIDIDAVRADTPGCGEVIHLNNAGASLPPTPVLSATIDFLEAEARTGSYEVASSRVEDLNRVYDAGAVLLGCQANELAYLPSATHAWNAALRSVAFEPGDRVLATTSEYVANVYGLIQLQDEGVDIDLIPEESDGQASLEGLEKLLDERVKLVCATHVPTSGGLVNPVAEIGRLAGEAGALYLLDATQSAGQMSLAVDELGCDFLAITGRKFLRGPRGTALLYARSDLEGLRDPLIMDGRSARWTDDWAYELSEGARRYETFETNVAAKVGFGVAIEYALRIGLDSISKRVTDLADSLRTRLATSPLVRLTDLDGPQSGIVTFYVEGRSSEAVVAALRAWGVNTSVVEPLPSGFDPQRRVAQSLIRASVHYFNTEEELDDAVAAL
ncbi:MAG: aminotransferase class V-fold PLP-dependent enzyme [Acidimicrobiia bacterium]|nr:aminotransferase class V-fold PLP-dependent enzyme [Acidimicrobiia bacterium]